jgi:hypothetical protein
MRPGASRVRALVAAACVLAVGACDSERTAPRAAGPDLAGVTTAAELATAVDAYDGPYTIRITHHRDGEADVVHFDGRNVSLRFADGYENRAMSDGWCYQGSGSNWVRERTAEDEELTLHRYLALSVGYGDQWTDAFHVEDHDEHSITLRANGAPPPGSVNRAVLHLDDGRPTDLVAFIGVERYATERYSWDADPPVRTPRRAEDGYDVTC